MFTHLHVASGVSARYGAANPEDLVRRAAELGMTELVLTSGRRRRCRPPSG
ncbi:hypothetical protein [Streptomyces sp. NPDC059862]|uniref:hypothetical protein n=1 Tax=unclassified Streptomyces TaxID=2593676 RepID=UPI003641D63E